MQSYPAPMVRWCYHLSESEPWHCLIHTHLCSESTLRPTQTGYKMEKPQKRVIQATPPKKAKAPPAKSKAKPVAKTPARPRGRPSLYTPAIDREICLRISNGEPLRQICRDDHMPEWRTIYDWQANNKDFYARIAHARELGEDAIAQECMEIADSAKNDWMEARGQDDEGYRLNGEHIQRSKLRIETRLKLLAKWNPRKWGEKVDLNHGVQPENPLATLLQRIAGTGLPVVKERKE